MGNAATLMRKLAIESLRSTDYNDYSMDGMRHLAVCASSWLLALILLLGPTGREMAFRKMCI